MPPKLLILAGPNGAGKTTFARQLLPGLCDRFVNADEIARDLSPADPNAAAVAAGRRALTLMRQFIAERVDFAFETTLAGRAQLPLLERARAARYEVRLWYLWLASPDLAVQRVATRVHMGGHAIPERVIRRRYAAGLRNLFRLYRSAVDAWYLYDTSEGKPVTVAFEEAGSLSVYDLERYERIRAAAEDTDG